MTGAVLLAAYVVAAGSGAPAGLLRGWPWRAPRLAIAVWLMLAASWLAAVTLTAAALAAPFSLGWPGSGSQARETIGGTPAALAALLPAAAVVGWACWHLARGLAAARRGHRAQARFLAAVGRFDPALGAIVTAEDTPAAYCLPCGRHRVVISSGALSRLNPGQQQAVLAHERAHLHGRHHLILAVSAALARAFPVVPLLSRAAGELAVLAEMAADDAAARRHERSDLAAALVTMAGAVSPGTGLTAGGAAAVARIQRLLAPSPRPALAGRTARLALALAAMTIPAGIAVLPLAAVACGFITRT